MDVLTLSWFIFTRITRERISSPQSREKASLFGSPGGSSELAGTASLVYYCFRSLAALPMPARYLHQKTTKAGALAGGRDKHAGKVSGTVT